MIKQPVHKTFYTYCLIYLKNTINKVEPEDSNSYLTEQNPAQNLKEILPILKNSPIDSANIDQGIIKKY